MWSPYLIYIKCKLALVKSRRVVIDILNANKHGQSSLWRIDLTFIVCMNLNPNSKPLTKIGEISRLTLEYQTIIQCISYCILLAIANPGLTLLKPVLLHRTWTVSSSGPKRLWAKKYKVKRHIFYRKTCTAAEKIVETISNLISVDPNLIKRCVLVKLSFLCPSVND